MLALPYRAAVIGRTGRGDYGHGLDLAVLNQAKLQVVAVADDDIADADGDPDTPCPFDLRAAHLDGIAVADILLDRGGEPWRRHVEVDGTGSQPPPQAAETAGKDRRQCADHDRKTAQYSFAK